jgi:uncharacterized protein (DUF58 family)
VTNSPSGDISQLVPEAVCARAVPAERWPLGFGTRFFIALMAGLVWLGPAWWDHRFAYAMLLWDASVLLTWLFDLSRLPKPNQIEVARQWESPLYLGESTEVTLRVSNEARAMIRVSLQDDVPDSLAPSPPGGEIEVRKGEARSLSYSVLPVSRGDTSLQDIHLRYQGLLRFAERRAAVRLKQTVRVYPSLRESKQYMLYLMRSRQIELEKRLRRTIGAGREFESLRDYREGDEPRDICWTATARRGKLVTRTYQMERSQQVAIVIDAGRLLQAKVQPLGHHPESPDLKWPSGVVLAKLDYAVSAALSLARVALYSGDAVGLTAYARSLQARLLPARGAWHLRTLVESLALVQGKLAEGDHQAAAGYLLSTHKRRSLVVWLTDLAETAATPEVIEAASRLAARHLVLFIAIGQPELYRLAAVRPTSVREAYRYVVAQEIIERRDLLLRRLRHQGALAFELEPNQLAAGLVNRYLEVKERSRL